MKGLYIYSEFMDRRCGSGDDLQKGRKLHEIAIEWDCLAAPQNVHKLAAMR